MSSSLVKLRRSAFRAQNGCCFYCGLPMWEDDPERFAQTLGLTAGQAQKLRSTAEHLQARCDGGGDHPSNIVAACALQPKTACRSQGRAYWTGAQSLGSASPQCGGVVR
jgi:hypothetical protein